MGVRKMRARSERISGMDRNILDIVGVAKLLGVSKGTIYGLAREGKIPAAKVGKEWRFARQNVIDWVSNGGQVDQLSSLLSKGKVRGGK